MRTGVPTVLRRIGSLLRLVWDRYWEWRICRAFQLLRSPGVLRELGTSREELLGWMRGDCIAGPSRAGAAGGNRHRAKFPCILGHFRPAFANMCRGFV
jgi:hypothetical protein